MAHVLDYFFQTADVKMTDILPSGNVAVGLVFNYFVGFLRQILPGKILMS